MQSHMKFICSTSELTTWHSKHEYAYTCTTSEMTQITKWTCGMDCTESELDRIVV